MATELAGHLQINPPSPPDYYARVRGAASALVAAVLTAEALDGMTMPVCVEVEVDEALDILDAEPSAWMPPVPKYRVFVEFWPDDE